MFNPRKPILRSELAFALTEGLNAKSSNVDYSDVTEGYWAKDRIDTATDAGYMIGYPSGVFKPDQPITKAEVFATIAKQINVKYNDGVPWYYKGKAMQHIPSWAYNATNEVIASGLFKQCS